MWAVVYGAASAAEPASADNTFAGTWGTTFGRITLTQDGQKVKGFCLMEGVRCLMEGQIEKNKLTFRHQEDGVK